jgi:hypothetical protein
MTTYEVMSLDMVDGLPRPRDLDVVSELTIEEKRLASLVSNLGGRRRELLKCRREEGGIFYLVVDENGGAWFETIDELREFAE